MAICELCNREMLTAIGCNRPKVIFINKNNRNEIYQYNRIRVGDPNDFMSKEERLKNGCVECHDCGAHIGGIHHDNCDEETCPKCGGQFLSCSCGDDYDIYYDEVIEKEKMFTEQNVN